MEFHFRSLSFLDKGVRELGAPSRSDPPPSSEPGLLAARALSSASWGGGLS